MSNSYNPSTILADPSSTVAGREVTFETPQRMANSINYCFGRGHCTNVLSQAYGDRSFNQDASTFTEMSQWRIPLVSLQHNQLECVVNYRLHGSSANCDAKFSLDVGGSTASVTINLPTSTNGIANGTISITMPASDQYYGTLTMEVVGAGSTAEVQIFSVMASWEPLTSPLSAGAKYQYNLTDAFYPMGTTRTGTNQALTSRFGHHMIDDIEIVRQRMRSYLTWSGLYSASSSSSLSVAAASEIYVGVGLIGLFASYPLIPTGFEQLQGRKLEAHIRTIGSITFDFFGNRIEITRTAQTVGWTIVTLEVDNATRSERGDTNAPYYLASIEYSDDNVKALVSASPSASGYNNPTTLYPTVDAGNDGNIIGFTLMGV